MSFHSRLSALVGLCPAVRSVRVSSTVRASRAPPSDEDGSPTGPLDRFAHPSCFGVDGSQRYLSFSILTISHVSLHTRSSFSIFLTRCFGHLVLPFHAFSHFFLSRVWIFISWTHFHDSGHGCPQFPRTGCEALVEQRFEGRVTHLVRRGVIRPLFASRHLSLVFDALRQGFVVLWQGESPPIVADVSSP